MNEIFKTKSFKLYITILVIFFILGIYSTYKSIYIFPGDGLYWAILAELNLPIKGKFTEAFINYAYKIYMEHKVFLPFSPEYTNFSSYMRMNPYFKFDNYYRLISHGDVFLQKPSDQGLLFTPGVYVWISGLIIKFCPEQWEAMVSAASIEAQMEPDPLIDEGILKQRILYQKVHAVWEVSCLMRGNC